MTRSFQPARMAAAATLGVAALLASACSAGQTAQTASQKSTVDGAAGDAGDIGLRYLRVAYPDGGRYQAGANALLQFFAVNSGPVEDNLVSVRTDVATQVAVQPGGSASALSNSATGTGTGSTATGASANTDTPTAAVPIPPNGLVRFGQGEATVQLIGLTRDLLSGQTVAITFTFARNGTLTVEVPVATSESVVPKPSPVLTTTAAP